jgi:hypothetical protein
MILFIAMLLVVMILHNTFIGNFFQNEDYVKYSIFAYAKC